MTKEEFQELLQRYRAGDCSEEESRKVNSWFAKISDDSLELNDFEKMQINKRMLSAIRQTLPSNKPQKVRSLILTGSSGLYESGMGDSYPRRGDYEYIKKKK